MSRRLRRALRETWMREGRPESGFVARVDHANYRNRTLRGLCKATGIGTLDEHGVWASYTPHNLRDTYASQLLSAGMQLVYVSAQLGHADVAVTARHYARWCGDDAFRRPLEAGPGEVPADLLARLGEKSHQSPTTIANA
ncbi:MAG TPA: tyrosine-type recombinase/integrase [Myxococcota bacterium]